MSRLLKSRVHIFSFTKESNKWSRLSFCIEVCNAKVRWHNYHVKGVISRTSLLLILAELLVPLYNHPFPWVTVYVFFRGFRSSTHQPSGEGCIRHMCMCVCWRERGHAQPAIISWVARWVAAKSHTQLAHTSAAQTDTHYLPLQASAASPAHRSLSNCLVITLLTSSHILERGLSGSCIIFCR